jgi:hypothetical protein
VPSLDLPTSPDSMNAGSLSHIDDKVNVGVVVVVASTRHLDVSIGHPDVLGVNPQIFRGSHDREFDGSLIPKRLVGPFSDRTNLFYSGDTVVGDEDLFIGMAESVDGVT